MNVIYKYRFNKENCAYVLANNGVVKLMRRRYSNHNFTDILDKGNEIERLQKERDTIKKKNGKRTIIKGYFNILKYCFFGMAGYTLLTIFNFSMWHMIVKEVVTIMQGGIELCCGIGLLASVVRTVYNVYEIIKSRKEIANIDQKISELAATVEKMKQDDCIVEVVICDRHIMDDETAEQVNSLFEKGGIVGALKGTFYDAMLESLLKTCEEEKRRGL